jgi:hypothetical protein
MAVTKNDVTGDKLQSKTTSKKYRDNWDLIFKQDKDVKEVKKEVK